MKRYLVILALVTLLTLIIIIGVKLSNDAIAVIIGVGLGILASIPTSLLLVFLLTRQNGGLKNGSPQPGLPNHQQPPVVIVNSGHPPGLSAGSSPPAAYQMDISNPRTFTIIGEETTES
jgi:hypothetical protein